LSFILLIFTEKAIESEIEDPETLDNVLNENVEINESKTQEENVENPDEAPVEIIEEPPKEVFEEAEEPKKEIIEAEKEVESTKIEEPPKEIVTETPSRRRGARVNYSELAAGTSTAETANQTPKVARSARKVVIESSDISQLVDEVSRGVQDKQKELEGKLSYNKIKL
jgi:hypothetical protein